MPALHTFLCGPAPPITRDCVMWVRVPGADLQGQVFSSPGLRLPPCSCLSLPPVGWGGERIWVLPDHSCATSPFSVGSSLLLQMYVLGSAGHFQVWLYLLYFHVLCDLGKRFLPCCSKSQSFFWSHNIMFLSKQKIHGNF